MPVAARKKPKRRVRRPTAETSPVTVYARRVVAGEIVAGRLVQLACQRHLRDLETGHERGLVFDAVRAQHALDFFGWLRLSEGEWADQPFVLEPWQQFIVGSLFGWLRTDGIRRFRTSYVEVARGNGKSPLAAGLGLYGLVADGERGAHVYSAATTRDQAKIVYGDAEKMVGMSPSLQRRVSKRTNNLSVDDTGSFFRPLSADASKMDGLRVHLALVDEVHEHPSSGVIDKLRTGTKGRRQPMIFEVTTAGWDQHSICYQHHEYSVKVLESVIANDEWFAFIATIDEGDRWDDPAVWIKANPNLGVSIKPEYIAGLVREAQEMPARQNVVRRLNLNQWTEQAERAIDMDVWDRGAEAIDAAALKGRRCFAGLDLARVCDLSALALVFPPIEPNERWKVLARFWIPEADREVRSRRDRVPYDVWVRQGLITATPGNATDFAFIESEILKLCKEYDVREVAYDRTFADAMVQRLTAEGITMAEFGQGFLSMAAPTAELLRLLLAGQLQHGGGAVLRWNASNLSLRQDPAGNLKPDKERSVERIDGIVALCMALGRAIVHTEPAPTEWLLTTFDLGGLDD